MSKRRMNYQALDGNAAVAEAMRQIDPDVVAAYPITPSTAIPETFADFVANGLVNTEFIPTESEHSAMSACIGAAAAGGRVITATASAGLAYMWELLYVAASMRLPMVMIIANRALSGPINIHCDHSDTMGARDAGWIQIFSEDAQEAYENTLQAVRISEHMAVRLPVMVMQDGFLTSHSIERVAVYDDADVRRFLGEYQPLHPLLEIENPVTYGALDFYDYYFEHKRQQVHAMQCAQKAIVEIGDEFRELFGRSYGLFDTYRMEDAEAALVVLSSTAGTARVVVDRLRAEKVKVGLIKLRVFRPFPADEIVAALGHVGAIAVMDRSISFGSAYNGGPVWHELVMAAHTRQLRIPIVNYVFGLGGRDTGAFEIEQIYRHILRTAETGCAGNPVHYVGVRGDKPLAPDGNENSA